MRFLIDENFPYLVMGELRRHGHDPVAVYDTMRGALDEDILARARTESRIVITADKDFGDLIFAQRLSSAGVLLIRSRSDRPAAKIAIAMAVIEELGDLLVGSFVVAAEEGRRIRKLK
ncbi:MAG TPA: DUF5615 family PIN-like protein [Thermoplasmata archaeon]|nr:DUF5615 family PIN-like protein [Thermoplasmata archaeon]